MLTLRIRNAASFLTIRAHGPLADGNLEAVPAFAVVVAAFVQRALDHGTRSARSRNCSASRGLLEPSAAARDLQVATLVRLSAKCQRTIQM